VNVGISTVSAVSNYVCKNAAFTYKRFETLEFQQVPVAYKSLPKTGAFKTCRKTDKPSWLPRYGKACAGPSFRNDQARGILFFAEIFGEDLQLRGVPEFWGRSKGVSIPQHQIYVPGQSTASGESVNGEADASKGGV